MASTLAFAQHPAMVGSQKIASMKVEPSSTTVGQEIRVSVLAEGATASNCGLVISFDDGTQTSVKVARDHQTFPVTATHTYSEPGTYSITAQGRVLTPLAGCAGAASAKVIVKAAPVTFSIGGLSLTHHAGMSLYV